MSAEDELKIPLLADGFEDAFIGSVYSINAGSHIAVYDVDKCISVLVGQGMTEDEAREYLDFNVVSAYVGELTPLFLQQKTLTEFDSEYE